MEERAQRRRDPSSEGVPAKWAPIAVMLGGPGSYEEYHEGSVVVGIRPGPMQYVAAFLCFVFALVGLALAWEGLPWLGVPLALLFGAGGVAVTRFRQRTEITTGTIRVRVKQLGGSWSREWKTSPGSACMVNSYRDHDDQLRTFRAVVLTAEGWIPLAESGDMERVQQFARRVARAAGVECLA